MKKIFKTFAFIAGVVLILSACDEYNDLTAPPPADSGNADFTRFVTIGNSLTAGYHSSSLYKSVQEYSYGKLIADVMAVSFAQPLVSDPGTGGRLEIESLDPFNLFTNPNAGEPQNSTHPAPYNNLACREQLCTMYSMQLMQVIVLQLFLLAHPIQCSI